MVKKDTDHLIEETFRAMRSERPADPAWAGRAWAAIESRLDRNPGLIRLPWGLPLVRWTVAVACLVLTLGWFVHQRRSEEQDLGAYVIALYTQNNNPDSATIPESILLTGGSGFQPVGFEEDNNADPNVIDVLMEI